MAYPLISGQKVVTTHGTAVALGTTQIDGPLSIKALDTNTGVVAIGNDGADDITVSNGYRLSAGEERVFVHVANLAALWLDSAVDGEGVCWTKLYV